MLSTSDATAFPIPLCLDDNQFLARKVQFHSFLLSFSASKLFARRVGPVSAVTYKPLYTNLSSKRKQAGRA